MKPDTGQLASEVVDAKPAEARTMRLKQQRNERSRHRSAAAPASRRVVEVCGGTSAVVS